MTDRPAKGEDEPQLIRLLESLRVVLPGLQLLFAFLLTVPYSSRFEDQGLTQKILLFGTLVGATISIVLLLAPLVGYRMRLAEVDTRRLRHWNRLVLAGLLFLALTLVGAVATVTELLWQAAWVTAAAGGLTASLLVVTWTMLPHARR